MHYGHDASTELDELLTECRGLSRKLEELKRLHPDFWPMVTKKLRIRWISDSNALEGSTLTFADTLFFLEEGLTVEGKPLKDFLDARNHADAIDFLMDVIGDKRPITPGLMKEINALLMSGVKSTPAIDQHGQKMEKAATPGDYKQLPNHVLQADGTIHRYVDPLHVAAEMEKLIRWVNAETGKRDPIIVAAIAHYNFVRIHPFDDGNGRGARILMNLILMKAGYIPAVVRNEERRLYIDALRAADHGELIAFIYVVAHAVADTLISVIEDLQQGTA